MFIEKNLNRDGKHVGDCTVRAIAKALDQSWNKTYLGITIQGFIDADMPSSNSVWGNYLRRKGFTRHIIPHDSEITVAEFAEQHPEGTYVLALDGHVVCVKDGAYIDSWNSGQMMPFYYWTKNKGEF